MNRLMALGAAGSVGALVLATGSPALAADGDQRTSDAVGGDVTCSIHRDGSRDFYVQCRVRDTKADGNKVRIEWSGPGRSGKDEVTSGSGTYADFKYSFNYGSGSFTFKAVVDRGPWPDSVGATRTLSV